MLGAIAGVIEALLVLRTGIAPPTDIAINLGLLIGTFGFVGGVWTIVRSYDAPFNRISGEAVLLLVSVLVFALRGCLHDCDADIGMRIGVPTGVLVLSLLFHTFVRRSSPIHAGPSFIVIATAAMTACAIDFAVRDGLVGSSGVLISVATTTLLLGVMSSLLVGRGWMAKLVWTAFLALGVLSWAGSESRPPRIHTVAKKGNSLEGLRKAQTPNVILIVMDTVRADHMSLFGYTRRTSPNLDALAEQSLVFDHAIASGNYSLPSHASLFTGLLPAQHGAHLSFGDGLVAANFRRVDAGLASGVETIASRLGALGFATGGASANYAYLARWTGLQQGFDAFAEEPRLLLGYHPFSFPFLRRLAMTSVTQSERREWDGESITKAGSLFATEATEPFLLFLNYLDAHDPYIPRVGHIFRADGLGSDVRPIPAYDSEIAYVDSMLGDLLSVLRDKGILDRTILVIAADHGEFFGEHGFTNHKVGAYEEVLHVPLLVRYPRGLRVGRIQRAFGLHEVHRLVLDILEKRPTDWVYAEEADPRVLAQVWGRVSAEDKVAGARTLDPDANVVYMNSYKLIDRRVGDDELR